MPPTPKISTQKTPTHRITAGKISKPSTKPSSSSAFSSTKNHTNPRRQRLAPKLRALFITFVLQRLECNGLSAKDLSRAQLREYLGMMNEEFLSIAAGLERGEREVEGLGEGMRGMGMGMGTGVEELVGLMEEVTVAGLGGGGDAEALGSEDLEGGTVIAADYQYELGRSRCANFGTSGDCQSAGVGRSRSHEEEGEIL